MAGKSAKSSSSAKAKSANASRSSAAKSKAKSSGDDKGMSKGAKVAVGVAAGAAVVGAAIASTSSGRAMVKKAVGAAKNKVHSSGGKGSPATSSSKPTSPAKPLVLASGSGGGLGGFSLGGGIGGTSLGSGIGARPGSSEKPTLSSTPTEAKSGQKVSTRTGLTDASRNVLRGHSGHR